MVDSYTYIVAVKTILPSLDEVTEQRRSMLAIQGSFDSLEKAHDSLGIHVRHVMFSDNQTLGIYKVPLDDYLIETYGRHDLDKYVLAAIQHDVLMERMELQDEKDKEKEEAELERERHERHETHEEHHGEHQKDDEETRGETLEAKQAVVKDVVQLPEVHSVVPLEDSSTRNYFARQMQHARGRM
jgi:hypothetical protein